jgi:uncharacterized lipoprotein YddW (UPF0748 family)
LCHPNTIAQIRSRSSAVASLLRSVAVLQSRVKIRPHIALIALLPLLFVGAAIPRLRAAARPHVSVLPPARAATPARRGKAPMVEARAVWVERLDYKTETIPEVMRLAARAHFNIVYFQVRVASDALYPSRLDPCAPRLCGRLGGATPEPDPLEIAVREAHRNGLQLHVWLNALSGWYADSAYQCARLEPSAGGEPEHVLVDHPDWAVHYRSGRPQRCPNEENYVFLSPANPGVRTHLARVAADLVRRYPVDGVHLDRIRYPGPDFGWDPAALAAFGHDPARDSAGWVRFRTEMVNRTVREVWDSIHAVRPVPLSAAVWPIYDRRRLGWDHLLRPSSSGVEEYFQDPWKWARDGYLDAAVPMTYSRVTDPGCQYTQETHGDWRCTVADQVAGLRPTGRHLYAGILAGLGADEVEREIRIGRQLGVNGFSISFYSMVVTTDLMRRLPEGAFREPAVVPPMPWLH